MKKSELARQLDLMGDYISENAPDIVAAHASMMEANPDAIDRIIMRCLPTTDEVTAMRIGAVAGLMYAHDMLDGEDEPLKPDVDARAVMASCIGTFLKFKISFDLSEDNDE